MYNYDTDAIGAGIGIGLTVFLLFMGALALLQIIGMWKIFSKAGHPGWTCLIPFYNWYVLFKIAWGSGVYFLLMFIPAANLIVWIILQIKLSKSFGEGDGFALGLIFLPFIFYLVLGFGKSRYIGPDGERSQTYVINQYNYNNGPVDQQEQAYNLKKSLDAATNDMPRDDIPRVDAPRVENSEQRFCMNCGATISSAAKFCKNCGTPVAALPQQPEAFADEPEPFVNEPEPYVNEPEPTLFTEEGSVSDMDRTEILIDEPVDLGPRMRMIRINDETGISDEFDVLGFPFVVGRSATDVDHEIKARGVSRKHMQIDFRDNEFFVTDMNSTNGVFVNGNRIPTMEQTAVENGDVIRIGQSEYTVEVEED